MYQTKIHPSNQPAFEPLDFEGVEMKTLDFDERTGAMTVITKMLPGASIPAHSHSLADETVYVLEGVFIEDGVSYPAGSYFAGAKGTQHGPHNTDVGCTILTHFSAALDFVLAKTGDAS